MARNKHQVLEDFKLRKKSRRLAEVKRLLESFGFTERKAKKENSVWSRGPVSLTLPTPHGTTLKVPYIRLIIRKIEEAELLADEEEDREDQDSR